MAQKIAIGIDLGTTNSCVGFVRDGKVEIIANDQGNRITPSCVAFTDEERLIGDSAKAQLVWNPTHTIYDAKRLIGRKYSDGEAQKKMNSWPFKIVADGKGNPSYNVNTKYTSGQKQFSPEEISSMVLLDIKKTAEAFIGHEIKDAVITVPAYFDDAQREATIDAGKIAGLNVLSLLNEPTAAAMAYGSDRTAKTKQKILVYDLGGGTFDVAVVSMEGKNYEVLAVTGDTYLGGGDIDNILLLHFTNEFKKKHGIDISQNTRATAKVRKACEKAKRNLSSSLKERIQIECLADGVDMDTTISRVRFEDLCSELFKTTLEPVEKVLKDAKLEVSDIDEVVLAGGSTRIPKIQELLGEFFNGKSLNKTINPDESVAYGAALQAAILAGESTIEEVLLQDVTPLSLGIDTLGHNMSYIIKKNTKIPVSKSKLFTTVIDKQKAVDINVYEGERAKTENNKLLGKFTLEDILVGERGDAKIDVTFKMDGNGILKVSAVDITTGCQKSIAITNNKGRLDEKEIERMIVEAKNFNEKDDNRREQEHARSELEEVCMITQQLAEDKQKNGDISSVDYQKICDECQATLEWLEDNPNAQKSAYEAKRIELQDLYNKM